MKPCRFRACSEVRQVVDWQAYGGRRKLQRKSKGMPGAGAAQRMRASMLGEECEEEKGRLCIQNSGQT